MSYLPFVVIVVVLGIWYANYFRSCLLYTSDAADE